MFKVCVWDCDQISFNSTFSDMHRIGCFLYFVDFENEILCNYFKANTNNK